MYQCKNCGDGLIYSISKKKLCCESCGSEFNISDYTTPAMLASETYEINSYSCPACGGEIVSADEQAVAYCPYCGSQVVLQKASSMQQQPTCIIPFSRGRKQSKEILHKEAAKAPFIPKSLLSEEAEEKMIGLYMPYWLYTISVPGHMEGTSIKTQITKEGKQRYVLTDYYNEDYDYLGTFTGYPKDASTCFDDHISEDILPFKDPQKAKNPAEPFHPAYLCGFYADTATTPEETYRDTVINEVLEYYLDKGDPDKMDTPSRKKRREQLLASKDRASARGSLGLFPVWFQTYRAGKRVCYGVVNGRNGNCHMDLPVDMGSFLKSTLLMTIPLFLAIYLFLPSFDIKVLNGIAGLVAWVGMLLGIFIQGLKYRRSSDVVTLGDSWGKEKKLRKRSPLLWVLEIILIGFFFLLGVGYGGFGLGFGIATLIYALLNFKKRMNIAVAVSFLAILVCGIVTALDPPKDIYYYGALFLSGATLAVSLVLIARIQKTLSERQLPYFERKETNWNEQE